MGIESPRRSVRTAVDLRQEIVYALTDAATAGPDVGLDESVDPQLRRIMLAIDDYIDHIRNQWLTHNTGTLRLPTVADLRTGPSLTYVHTNGDTMTNVDQTPVPATNPRERAISRALITEALRLLNQDDTP